MGGAVDSNIFHLARLGLFAGSSILSLSPDQHLPTTPTTDLQTTNVFYYVVLALVKSKILTFKLVWSPFCLAH